MAAPKKPTPAKKPAAKRPSAVAKDKAPLTPKQKFRAWSAGEGAMGELCAFIVANGAKGHLEAFCKANGFAYQTVLDWIDRDKDRAGLYARAREDRSDTLAEQIVSLTEDADVMTPILAENAEGRMVVVGEMVDKGKVQLLKIKADNLKWVASKLKPKVYGDKLDLTAKIDTNELTDEALARKLAGFGVSIKAVQEQGGANGGA